MSYVQPISKKQNGIEQMRIRDIVKDGVLCVVILGGSWYAFFEVIKYMKGM